MGPNLNTKQVLLAWPGRARRRATVGEPPPEIQPGDGPALWAAIREQHASLREAVRADTEITARYRGERHVFRSNTDLLLHVVRLAFVTDSFFAQLCYRAKAAARARRIPVLPHVLQRLAIVTGQICIGDTVVMRPGIYIPHGQVVVDGLITIEEGVVLRPFVTIGLRDGYPVGPAIGPRVRIGTGAKVFGPVVIGAGAQIGANAVVNTDVPAGATAVGVPARIVDPS